MEVMPVITGIIRKKNSFTSAIGFQKGEIISNRKNIKGITEDIIFDLNAEEFTEFMGF